MLIDFKAANLLMNDRFICVETYSGRGLMGKDPNGICEFHSLGDPNAAIGSSLRMAINASRWISLDDAAFFFAIQTRKKINEDWIATVRERFGLKSKKAVFHGMMCCSVRCVEGIITVKPSVHVKLEAWTEDGVDASASVHLSMSESDEALGEAARLALSRCR